MNIITVGLELDLAKSVFHVVCFNEQFKEVKKRKLRRNKNDYESQGPVKLQTCAYLGGSMFNPEIHN